MEDTPPKIKILIADDILTIRKLLSMVLMKQGYEVIEAVDGEETLLKFEQERPNLILLDIMMPKMFGWDVLQQIKKEHPSTKVIVMTAVYKKSSYRRQTIHEYGADEFITKPFKIPEVLALVEKILNE
ncbi:response regulator transcription factor [candidate division CSSED10-310 bacterium]|uniref:Response regulator transcription factor n=1 Tax=candidate division CSSED10-310 bacterium TaxID=2855610 RepID=A0ABV6Z1A9_UNCC1